MPNHHLHPCAQMVRWFWEVAHSLSDAQKKKLLAFVTGSDRVPIKVGAGARASWFSHVHIAAIVPVHGQLVLGSKMQPVYSRSAHCTSLLLSTGPWAPQPALCYFQVSTRGCSCVLVVCRSWGDLMLGT